MRCRHRVIKLLTCLSDKCNQAAVHPQTKPTDFDVESVYRLLSSAPTIVVYYCYLTHQKAE